MHLVCENGGLEGWRERRDFHMCQEPRVDDVNDNGQEEGEEEQQKRVLPGCRRVEAHLFTDRLRRGDGNEVGVESADASKH